MLLTHFYFAVRMKADGYIKYILSDFIFCVYFLLLFFLLFLLRGLGRPSLVLPVDDLVLLLVHEFLGGLADLIQHGRHFRE